MIYEQGHETINFWDQEVKEQGHARPGEGISLGPFGWVAFFSRLGVLNIWKSARIFEQVVGIL